MNIVITGASRGIGLELTRQALEKGDQVLAVARDPKAAKGLTELAKKYEGKLQTCMADVSASNGPAKISAAVEAWSAVDVLINNAGIYLKDESAEDFAQSFQVNSVAPLFVTKALIPKLRKSGNPRVVQITSKMGSVEDNGSGGSYAYRASKSALNMINRSLAVDNPWLTTIVMHPGWVKTEMGGSSAPVETEDSAAGIWRVARELKNSDSGKFFDFKGSKIPW